MNDLKLLKYLSVGITGLYLYKKLENSGLSKEYGSLNGRAEMFIDQALGGIKDPVLKEKVSKVAKKAAKEYLKNHMGIIDLNEAPRKVRDVN